MIYKGSLIIILAVLIGMAAMAGPSHAGMGSTYPIDTAPDGVDSLIGIDTDDTTQGPDGSTKQYLLESLPISLLVQAALGLKQAAGAPVAISAATNVAAIGVYDSAKGYDVYLVVSTASGMEVYVNTGAGLESVMDMAATGLVFGGAVYAPEFISTAPDGTRYIDAINGVAITATPTNGLVAWYNGELRRADGVDWNDYFVRKESRPDYGAVDTVGSFSAPITANPYALNVANCYGAKVYYGATGEIDLPAGVDGMNALIYNTGAFTITIDPNGSTVIVRDGTAQTGGVSMVLSSGAGNYVALVFDGARWVTMGYKGTLTVGS